ncbi:GTPase family protein [Zavarzinella formosa]|uniref:GTPase family protein n=1 Tax=Zavarzinella formosa TaxID=360055 RepID=UPI00031DD13A|nr:GTPase [Zavarzinella formosa]
MTRLRLLAIILLIIIPLLFYMGVGAYHLFETGWTFYVWWPTALCFGTAYFLGWQVARRMKTKTDSHPGDPHWTDRDQFAWGMVQARVEKSADLDQEALTQPKFYYDTAEAIAKELSVVYQPGASDPVGPVTIPELLTVIELATRELHDRVRKYVPGSHLMTIDHWRKTQKAIGWMKHANNGYWVVSAVLNPVKTAARYLAAKTTLTPLQDRLQRGVINWFYAEFISDVGRYLIELYSGRLKVGAEKYRELQEQTIRADEGGGGASPEARPVTITVIGQVKAGKSSLINALLGERKAQTDVLPCTDTITEYVLKSSGLPATLHIMDSIGYSHEGADADQVDKTAEVVRQSDLVLLVGHARNAAKQADVNFVGALQNWFRTRPQYKIPPIMAVLTHADLLTPAMEWQPPYDWSAGIRPKEKSIRDAVGTARESFPDAANIVPACTAENRQWNVTEGVLAGVVNLLGEARGVAFLRCLDESANEDRVGKVFEQLWSLGKTAYTIFRERAGK